MSVELANRVRSIACRTHGTTHGPITRLVSPGDLGEFLKPFVFLDLVDLPASTALKGFGMHPHSGIATLTYMSEGDVHYEDTTGAEGILPAGGVEWMQAGNGVWHTGAPVADMPLRGFQLWVALPAADENAPARSLYLAPAQVPREGPARVLLGRHGSAQSLIAAPSSMNYLSVSLRSGQRWRYEPPAGHDVAWVALSAGRLQSPQAIAAGELVIFEGSSEPIELTADGVDTEFVLGSAVKHPYDLVLGHYSVHTTEAALAQGDAEIRRIGARLQRQGRL